MVILVSPNYPRITMGKRRALKKYLYRNQV